MNPNSGALLDLEGGARFQKSIGSRIEGLDELRGIAILWVMISHGAGLLTWAPRALAGWGVSGVLLFFFVSGYLITRILMGGKADRDFTKKFYIRRILRIWPLMLVMLAVSAYFYPETANLFPFNLGLTNNYYYAYNGPVMARTDVMWSLAIEEHFYLVWPLIVLLLPLRVVQWACMGFIVLGFCLSKGVIPYGVGSAQQTLHNVHYLALGCALAFGRDFFIRCLLLLACLFVLWLQVTGGSERSFSMSGWLYNAIWILFYLLVAQTLFGLAGNWKLRSRVLANLGKLCYGLYLIHFFVSAMVHHVFRPNMILSFLLYLAFSYVLAFLSFKMIEVPVQNLRMPLEKNSRAAGTFLAVCSMIFFGFLSYTVPKVIQQKASQEVQVRALETSQ